MNKRTMIGNIKHKCLLTEDWGYVGNVGNGSSKFQIQSFK